MDRVIPAELEFGCTAVLNAGTSFLSGAEIMSALREARPPTGLLRHSLSSCNQHSLDSPTLISIVDDDKWVCRSLERLLKSEGFRAQTFVSAEDYLRFGNYRDTICLILDVKLPGMSGFELQQRLAVKQKEVPIIMISALDGAEARNQAFAWGAVAFLGKPFDEDSLMDALESALK